MIYNFICIAKNFFQWVFSVDGSQVIYNLGLGVGGIIGAFIGGRVIKDEIRRKILIEKYSKKYYHKLFNTPNGWELTQNPFTLGDIYILDHRTKTKHWIANWNTFVDLRFPQRNYLLTDEKRKLFIEYKEGKQILTTGRPEPS